VPEPVVLQRTIFRKPTISKRNSWRTTRTRCRTNVRCYRLPRRVRGMVTVAKFSREPYRKVDALVPADMLVAQVTQCSTNVLRCTDTLRRLSLRESLNSRFQGTLADCAALSVSAMNSVTKPGCRTTSYLCTSIENTRTVFCWR
jgi:hypothetical protein